MNINENNFPTSEDLINSSEVETETVSGEESETETEAEQTEQTNEDVSKNWEAEAKKWKAIAERRKKQQEKNLKNTNKETSENKQKEPEYITRDEAIMLSKGYDVDDIDKLNIIARGLGVSKSEAIKSDLFVSYYKNKKEEERKVKAQMGASSGAQASNNVAKQGMTAEEHRKFWQEYNNK